MKSLLMVAVCTLIVLFLFLYIGSMQANQIQLANLPDAMPVYARISNLNGTMNSGGILIKENVINTLTDSPHVTELAYTVPLGVALGRITEQGMQDMKTGDLTFPLAAGANGLIACPGLLPENITFIDGAGPEFLEGEEALCIIRNGDMERNNLELGDRVWMTLFYATYPNDRYDLTYKWLGMFEVKIVGSRGDVGDSADGSIPSQIIFPAKWIQRLHKDAGIMFFADSARFRVAHPLELNAFKAQMKELQLMPVISQAQHSHRGNALTVNDEVFVRAASRLMDNITLMRVFTPFVCVIVGLVGFVVSYLLMNSRKPEIAIMRSMGMSRGKCFAMLFLENFILELVGSSLGILAATLFAQMSAALAVTVVALFFACYMAGTAAALVIIGRFSVMAVLAALE
ncbi:ABC transporter permease [Oscillospiraceae bacterium MB08-C2-2]|nr:ABC transporter permease [Oscillospiraceae bacterium MB08-C2-2]